MKSKNRKLRVLIAEGGSHYKILEQLYHLTSQHCILHFYLIDTKRFDWREIFPSWKQTKVIKCGFKGIPFFAKLIFLGWKYDVINISTGPDGDHWTSLFSILPFYLVCTLYKRKIIFTFRNISPYLPTADNIYTILRNKSIRKLKRFTFESKTMRDTFKKRFRIEGALCGVSYDKYTDVQMYNSHFSPHNDYKNEEIRIGLLGHISEKRRDYDLVCNALSQLSNEQRKKLKIVTMGFILDANSNRVIQKLLQSVKVDWQKGMLSEEDFEKRGRSCHIFLAPLNHKKEYGTLFGTGSLGDAISLRKKMIIPAFADPAQEFRDICYYYKTETDLSKILGDIDTHIGTMVAETYYNKFKTKQVLSTIKKDLQLEKMCSSKS